MDDLSGLDMSGSNPPSTNKPPPMNSASPFANLRTASPMSGRSTPLSVKPAQSQSPAQKPANKNGTDSFATLVPFSSSNSERNVSLAERQRRLEAQKAAEAEAQRKQIDAQFGSGQFWDALEKKSSSPPHPLPQSRNPFAKPAPVQPAKQQAEETEADILAAFSASAPVDSSSYYPVGSSASGTPVFQPQLSRQPQAQSQDPSSMSLLGDDDDDDDVFGLSQLKQKTQSAAASPAPNHPNNDDDDILGDLAKPITDFPKSDQQKPLPPAPRQVRTPSTSSSSSGSSAGQSPITENDKNVAALVDMGFPADKARVALAATDSGTNVQAAVGILLTQAHEESRQKAKGQRPSSTREPSALRQQTSSDQRGSTSRDNSIPPWMRSETRSSRSDRDSRSLSASGERDASQIAAEFGATFLKSANTFWKTSTKKVQQALNELNEPHDPNQPRWMREVEFRHDELSERQPRRQQTPRLSENRPMPDAVDMTDEAIMLESGGAPPRRQQKQQQRAHVEESNSRWDDVLQRRAGTPDRRSNASPSIARQDMRPAAPSPPSQRREVKPQMPFRPKEDPKARLNRMAVDEQAAQAYVSPARRRHPKQRPSPEAQQDDLLDSGARQQAPQLTTKPTAPTPPKSRNPAPQQPKLPPRVIPDVSPSVLSSSHQLRQKGAEAYKRGDYAAAHGSYTDAIAKLPETHPIVIILLCNHALTSLKIGEPKNAIVDAEKALSVIGPSNGESESIELGSGEGTKNMKEFYGKALMRKAEALEQLERWPEAAEVWRAAVLAGCGGNTAIQGRNRCEKAAGVGSASRTSTPSSSGHHLPSTKRPAAPLPRASPRPQITSTKPAEAVNRLREANLAADRADDEKLALIDRVDEIIGNWTKGKKDNLRSLLASLDTVLWPEAGWKKIGMAELVLPNKVKINYMKGIAKVHPDKVSDYTLIQWHMLYSARHVKDS
ncbi:hypothetical protein KEM56_001463 [Ascosphaera pollenicola]|nr:hypothetical protein KEM56_001463 [Ascosphaera pollenicola]